MTMRHEFAVRFEPASGARFVQAEAYVRSLSAVLEGLASLRAALAPQLAQKHGWGVPQIRAALTFSVGPTATGSLIVPLVPGAATTGPPLGVDEIAQAFWSGTAAELAKVTRGKSMLLSASGAEAFARASLAARESAATLELASRAANGSWRCTVGITRLERSLRKHAEARKTGHRALTSLTGQITSLTYDPPGFVLAAGSARRIIRMPSALRDVARENWGREVVVLTDAVITEEGSVADVQALEIRPAASAQEADKHFDETFGILRGDWDSAELEAYLGTPTSH